MSERLTPLLRRVLASLPVWHEDEDAAVQSEVEEHGVSIRRHNLAEMHAQLAPNPHAQVSEDVVDEETGETTTTTRALTPEEVLRCLDWCVAQGYAVVEDVASEVEHGVERFWRMTQAGFEEIHRPEAAPENVVPGPVEIKPDPAEIDLSTAMEGGTHA